MSGRHSLRREVDLMKQALKTWWLPFFLILSLGFLLHFLYGWLPTPVTALFSPVRESLWEHVKIIFWPLLLAGLWATRTDRSDSLTPWLASSLIVNGLMLAVSYLWNVVLGLEGSVFNIALYVAAMILAFLLVPFFRQRLGEGGAMLVRLLALILLVLILRFTFSPPAGALFADLSGEVRTFLTIPV